MNHPALVIGREVARAQIGASGKALDSWGNPCVFKILESMANATLYRLAKAVKLAEKEARKT